MNNHMPFPKNGEPEKNLLDQLHEREAAQKAVKPSPVSKIASLTEIGSGRIYADRKQRGTASQEGRSAQSIGEN
jgi:hypothetical protein